MYKKILVAMDGSTPSVNALQHSAELAKALGSEKVTILHINKDLPLQEPLYNINLAELMDEENREILTPAVQFLTDANIPFETHTFHGDPANLITSYAKEHKYDVIVMGNKGKGFIQEALLGSVSHKVAHSAPCPVIIVK